MAHTLEEIAARYDFAKTHHNRAERVAQLRQNQSEALRVSHLIADPNWEIWCRYVEQLKRGVEERMERAKNTLLDLPPNHPGLVMELAGYRECRAQVKAYETCLSIAKVIVEQGEAAVKELQSMGETL